MNERCIAVTVDADGKEVRCSKSSKVKGAAKGFCPMHYQRLRRTQKLERTRADPLGASVQCVFDLPVAKHTRVMEIADAKLVTRSDVLREAVDVYLAKETPK